MAAISLTLMHRLIEFVYVKLMDATLITKKVVSPKSDIEQRF